MWVTGVYVGYMCVCWLQVCIRVTGIMRVTGVYEGYRCVCGLHVCIRVKGVYSG